MDGTQLESLDLLSRCALDRPVQGLVQRGPGSLVFRLQNAALLVFHFELKQLILKRFPLGWPVCGDECRAEVRWVRRSISTWPAGRYRR